MKKKETQTGKKLKFLQENRKKKLVRLLLDIELRGVDHRVHLTSDSRADLTVYDGNWVNDHIRTAIVKHNYEIERIPKLQIKDFSVKEIKEYEKTFLSDGQ